MPYNIIALFDTLTVGLEPYIPVSHLFETTHWNGQYMKREIA